MKFSFSPENGWSSSTEKILESHDVVFRAPVTDPTYGLPIGNGDSGCLLWLTERELKISLNKTDLWDYSGNTEGPYCTMEDENLTVCRQGGELVLDFGCPIFENLYQNRFEGRLSLYDAKASLAADTPFGGLKLSAFSSEKAGVSVVRTELSYREAMSLRVSLRRYGSRTMFFWYSHYRQGTGFGLEGTKSEHTDDTMLITQRLNRNSFAVAVKPVTALSCRMAENGSREVQTDLEPARNIALTLYIAIETGKTPEIAAQKALKLVNQAEEKGEKELYREHAAAWKSFWSKTFVSLPADNDYVENLWYLNLYYANSEMKGKSPAHFCNGIWGFYHDFVPWNHFFHYNMQLATFPLEAANHPELLETYYDFRFNQLPRAREVARNVKNTRGAFYTDVCDKDGRCEIGTRDNCTCGAQIAMYLYAHYRYSGDRGYLDERALPVMREIGYFYLDMLKMGEDGYYHIHKTTGYEGSPLFDDSITDLSMIRALFAALAKELPDQEALPYRECLEKLTPYTVTELFEEEHDGKVFLHGIGKGETLHGTEVLAVGKLCDSGAWLRRTFGKPEHDYYGFPDTEMSPVFPAGLVGIKDRGTPIYDRIYNSICLHHPAEAGNEDGYCMGWCMMPIYLARMGMSGLLQKQFKNTVSAWMLYPQGFGTYGPDTNNIQVRDRFFKNKVTNGQTGRVTQIPSWNFRHFDYETLPILATAVNEMLMQSYDGVLRFFCAVPDPYSCAFSLRAVGGFEVHAVYENGLTDIWVHSLLGGRLSVAAENITRPVTFYTRDGERKKVDTDNGIASMETEKGEWVHITNARNGITPEREYHRNEDVKTCGTASLGTGEEFC